LQGTRFTNAVANTPSCAPSRASLMTGLHTLSHRLVNNELQVRLDVPTFAGTLTSNGYDCGYIGKWHLDGGPRDGFTPPGPRRLGFDKYWAVANCSHAYMNSFYYENEDPVPRFIDGYEPIHQTDLALRFIEDQKKSDQPFFLTVSYGTPHDPYLEMPAELLEKVSPEGISLMETNSRYVPLEIREAKRKMLAGYYAHIEALDEQVGRLMNKLEAEGLVENTIVVFTSDHGDMLGNHDAYFKSQPWRESVGIPLIMRWPEHIPAGRVTNGPISIVDMMPTLLALTDTRVPKGVQGIDLSEFVQGDETKAAGSVFINFLAHVHIIPQPPFRGVVTGTHTYAESEEGPWLMYDDEKDFFQKNNLITWAKRSEPGIAALQKQLSEKVRQWMARIGDPGIWGDEVNERYQPGHVGGVLPHQTDPQFKFHQQAWLGRR
ncbi:MAG: sulfatase, partial [Spirochaetia bacterium]|nr:sulfatase [Spirochaetia bacterium]